jgi:hypothetical protein
MVFDKKTETDFIGYYFEQPDDELTTVFDVCDAEFGGKIAVTSTRHHSGNYAACTRYSFE